MAEEPQVRTIRFAGKDVDAHKFVRLAQSKVQQWMDYQMLQGDERTDFLNSFNNVLQGLVDGTYTTSDFGRILELPYETKQYREKDGAYQEGEKKWYHSARVGFDANANVETYLNGVADALDQVSTSDKKDEVKNKKKWSKNTLYASIKNAIFGDGNEFSQEQLTAWADAHDPVGDNGTRDTSKRRNFLKQVIENYQKEIQGDAYDITDEVKQEELNKIAGYLKDGVSDFELGQINSKLRDYLFTGSTYFTPEQKAQTDTKTSYNTYINTNDVENPISILDDPTKHNQLNELKLNRIKKQFLEYKGADFADTPFNVAYVKNVSSPKTTESLRNKSLSDMRELRYYKTPDGRTLSFDEYQSMFFEYINIHGKEVKDKKYIIDWDRGYILEAKKNKDDNSIYQCVLRPISKVIQDSISSNDQDLQHLLFEDYKNHYNVRIGKTGMALNEIDAVNNNNKPKEDGENTDSSGSDEDFWDFETDEWTFDNDATDGGNNSKLPRGDRTGRTPQPESGYSATDKIITNLENLKLWRNLQGNREVYNIGASIRGFHETPDFNVVKSFTSKPLEDGKAQALATLNQMGHAYAAGTTDQAKAFAGQIALHDRGLSTAMTYDAKNAEETNKTVKAEIDNSAKNGALRHAVGEANRKQDVSLYNAQKMLRAELASKNTKAITDNITARQSGIGTSAQKNEERALANAYLNDPQVVEAYNRYVTLYTQKYSGGKWDDNDEKALTAASFEYQRAIEQAKNWAALGRVQSINAPYATYSAIYRQPVPDPFPAH